MEIDLNKNIVVILPTSEIIKEYRNQEALLRFYKDGIRSIIGDLITDNVGRYNVDEILFHYSLSMDGAFNRIMNNNTEELVIETILLNLDKRIKIMLNTLFGRDIDSTVILNHNWQLNDLVILVKRNNIHGKPLR